MTEPVTDVEVKNEQAAPEQQPLPPNALNPQRVMAKVADVQFALMKDGVTTICVLQARNGVTVLGKSVCLDAAQYDKETSERVAYEDALNALFPLENYLLQEELFVQRAIAAATNASVQRPETTVQETEQ